MMFVPLSSIYIKGDNSQTDFLNQRSKSDAIYDADRSQGSGGHESVIGEVMVEGGETSWYMRFAVETKTKTVEHVLCETCVIVLISRFSIVHFTTSIFTLPL
jgi:hypothetical protein